MATAAPPSRPTFERWLAKACASGWLRKVRNGLFLNAAGNKSVSAGAAAGYIKQTAVPSLAWVANAMSIEQHLDEWLRSKRRYDEDPDVIENASRHLKASKPHF